MKKQLVLLKPKSAHQKLFLTLAILCLCLGAVSISPLASPVAELFNQNDLVRSNDSYLENVENTDRRSLLELSEIASSLSVLESSQVGMSLLVDASVKIGKAIEPLSKVTAKAFDLTFASIAVSIALRWLLNFAEMVAPLLFFICMLSASGYCLLRAYKGSINSFGDKVFKFVQMSALAFMCAHILIPYSIHSVALIERSLYADIEKQKNTDLHNLHGTLTHSHSKHSIKDKIESDIRRIEYTIIKLPHKVEVLVGYYSKHLILTVLRSVIFPLTIFYLLMMTMRSLLSLTPIKFGKASTKGDKPTMILH